MLYGIPFAETVILNLAIIVTILKRDIPGNTVAEARNRHFEKTNRRVIRMTLVVVAAFLLCLAFIFYFNGQNWCFAKMGYMLHAMFYT